MTQVTLVETCRHNLQTSLLAQIVVAESRTRQQLVQQGEQAKEIIARVMAEENKPKPERSTRRTPDTSLQTKRKDNLAIDIKSPVKPQSIKESGSSSQPRANKQYSFKDELIDSLFKLPNKSNRLKLPEARRPEEVGKIDNPNYCLHHRMLGYPTKSCYVFKDFLQALIDAEVLKLRPEQKKVTANLTSFLQFGRQPLTPSRVVPIPKGELRMISIDPTISKRRVLYLTSHLWGKLCQFILTLWMTSNRPLLPAEGPRGRRRFRPVMWFALLPEKQKSMFPH